MPTEESALLYVCYRDSAGAHCECVCVCVCVGDIVQRAVKFHAAPLGRGSAN